MRSNYCQSCSPPAAEYTLGKNIPVFSFDSLLSILIAQGILGKKCGFGPSEDGSPRRGYPPKKAQQMNRLNKQAYS